MRLRPENADCKKGFFCQAAIVYGGNIGIPETKMEATLVHWGYIGRMETKMESTLVYWGYIGRMESNMEPTMRDLQYSQRPQEPFCNATQKRIHEQIQRIPNGRNVVPV